MLWVKLRRPKSAPAAPESAPAQRARSATQNWDLEAGPHGGSNPGSPKARQPATATEKPQKHALLQSILATYVDVQAHAAALPCCPLPAPPPRGGRMPPAVAKTMVLLQEREVSRSQMAAERAAVQAYMRSKPQHNVNVAWEDEGAQQARQAAALRAQLPHLPRPLQAPSQGLVRSRGISSDASLSSEITAADSTPRSNSILRSSFSTRSWRGRTPHHAQHPVEQLRRAAARVQPGSPRLRTRVQFATNLQASAPGALPPRPQQDVADEARSLRSSASGHLTRSSSLPSEPLGALAHTASWVAARGSPPPAAADT